ncbi:sugar ABC transporter ATP-binding protein, partial [Vibrio sp. ER1A]
IAKALSHSNADIIFMDEPTSAIGEEDSQKLLNVIRSLASKGKGIVYVSHRLSEIFEVANQYTVFRDGIYITDGKIENVTREELVELIIGGQIDEEFSKFNEPQEEDLLTVNELTCDKFQNISFTVKKGEILGIYGLVGSGRSEVLDAIFGIKVPTSGHVCLNGKKIDNSTPRKSIASGLAYVTEDRKNTGLVLSSSVCHNISISSLKNKSSYHFVNHSTETEDVESMIGLFKIKTPNKEQIVQNLSGGNQQKVVLGRWSLTNPSVLMLDEPTRGIDVGAKKEIYKYMSEQALEGKGIIMVSSELPEVIGMSDRIVVFKDGKIVDIVPKENATQQLLLSLAS